MRAAVLAAALALTVAACGPKCGQGGQCISPEGAQILMMGFQGMRPITPPITYYPELYIPHNALILEP